MEDAVKLPRAAGKRPRRPDRLLASPEALARLNDWLVSLEERLKGTALTRNQLVNWLIMSHDASLSVQEIKQIEERFFDEVKFAEWAVKELRAAQARGESVRLADIVSRKRLAKSDDLAEKTKVKRLRNVAPKTGNTDEKK